MLLTDGFDKYTLSKVSDKKEHRHVAMSDFNTTAQARAVAAVARKHLDMALPAKALSALPIAMMNYAKDLAVADKSIKRRTQIISE